MLVELRVQNLALFEEAVLVLGAGLNVVTGETGAGKSLLVDALALALGGRAEAAVVRAGADAARVEAVFAPAPAGLALAAARAAGLAATDDDVLVFSREVQRSGRSLARVNGHPAAAGTVRALAAHLVEMAGQHDFQRLYRSAEHVEFLDVFAGEEALALRAEVAALAGRLREVGGRRRRLRRTEAERLQRLDLLRFQVAEIEAASPRPGEDAELARRLQVFANAGRLREALDRARACLAGTEDDRAPGARDLLAAAAAALGEAAVLDAGLGPEAEGLRASVWQVEELARRLDRYLDTLDYDPRERDRVAERAETLARLKRKYGPTLEDVLAHRERAVAEADALAGADADLEALAAEEERLRAALAETAGRLSAARAAAARALEARLAADLAELSLEGARCSVELGRRPAGAGGDGLELDGEMVAWDETGVDRVELLFSANPGEPLQPLARVASGGEASRLFLALCGLQARGERTFVFDEVDAGVGGRAARAVALRLARLAGNSQVLCVTHLAPVAALADRHYAVVKEERRGRTVAAVLPLEGEERAREVERLLAGGHGEASLAHARELMAWAGSVRGA